MDNEVYVKKGLSYDRITRILGYFEPPDLTSWRIKVGNKEAKRIGTIAKRIGTNVDEAIKCDVQGLKIPKLKSQEEKNCWEAWLSWKKDYAIKLDIPVTVYNDDLMVAGTPDLNSDFSVIDIKCSSEIRDSYWLQTEFYGRGLKGIIRKSILRLCKNLGVYEYKTMPLNDEHWEVVQGLIKAYRYYNNKTEQAPQKEVV